MANVSGRGVGAPQYQKNQQNVSASVPRVNFSEAIIQSSAGAQTTALLADTLQKIAGRMEDRLDIRATVEATAQGRKEGMAGVPQLQDEATIRGAAFNRSARDAVRTEFDLQARLKLDDLENQFQNDPVGFQAQAIAFAEGHLSALREGGYEDIAQEVAAGYEINSRNVMSRIQARQQAIMRDRQVEQALLSQITLQNDIQNMAGELFKADPKDVPDVLNNLMLSASKLTDIGSQIGPDGTPLFSARERVSFQSTAGDVLGTAIGLSYIENNQDMIDGYAALSDNIDQAFAVAINTESGGKQFGGAGSVAGPNDPTTSPKGAIGLAQVMPGTAKEAAQLAGLPWSEDRYRNDPDYNEALGRAYFKKQYANFGGIDKAYAAYNAGPGALQNAIDKAKAAGDPEGWLKYLPDETQKYVSKNMRSYAKTRPAIKADFGDNKSVDVTLDNILTPEIKAQAKKIYMENLRSELSLRNQIDAANDRALKEQSDGLFADMSVAAQDGKLTLNMVEAARNTLEPERYIALRELAKGSSATVSDGATVSYLAVKNANGEDIRDEALNALREGKITQPDFMKFYEDNNKKLSVGVVDPVQSGREYLTRSLGALSKDLGVGNSAAIAQAGSDYELKIQDFVLEKGRQPSHAESRIIAEDLRTRFSFLTVDENLLALPLPNSMTQAEKLSFNQSGIPAEQKINIIQDKVKSMNSTFLQKHGGDKKARDEDPEYKKEIKLLKQYYDLLKAKGDGNAR